MTARRDEALARLAQELQVPAHLLNLYPPAPNHWTAVADAQQDWRDQAIQKYQEVERYWHDRVLQELKRLMQTENRGWAALYDGPPRQLVASCYPGAYPPCSPWSLGEPDPCSIGDCLTCPGDAVGCGCRCHDGLD
jgi:hypothetical protein